MSQELKPCPTPWCARISEDLLVHKYPKGWVVQCLDCGVKSLPFKCARSAIASWNTRTPERTNAALLGAVKCAEGVVRRYCERNAKWDYEGIQQDPLGAHKVLDAIRAAIAEAESQKENGNG